MQKQEEELKNEHTRYFSKIYYLKIELEVKENDEKDLAIKIKYIYYHEEVIRLLERNNRKLAGKIRHLKFSLAAVTKNRETLTEKF